MTKETAKPSVGSAKGDSAVRRRWAPARLRDAAGRAALALGLLTLAGCGGASGSATADSAQRGLATVKEAITGDSGNDQANAGPDLEVTLPDTRAEIAGTAAAGGNVTWTQVSGPADVVFYSNRLARTGVATTVPGVYTLRMTVTGAGGVVLGSDEMQLTLKANPTVIAATSTPLDHLRQYQRPAIRPGHSLLPLTISSCALAPEIRLELMRHWGYAGSASVSTDDKDPVMAEIVANPGRYPLAFSQASLRTVFANYDGRDPLLPVLAKTTYLRDKDDNIILTNGRPTVSPLAPDSELQKVGEYMGAAMRKWERATGQRYSIVINNGESGLWIAGDVGPETTYGVDPRVAEAMIAAGLDPRFTENWFRFASRQKARQERIIKEAAYAYLSRGRPTAYSVYQESFGPERGRWGFWAWFMFLWEEFFDANKRPMVSDHPSPEIYYNFHNSGWAGFHPQTSIPYDALTTFLRDKGGAIELGQPLSYPWVSQGWDGGDSGGVSDDEGFIGAMKMLYAAGSLGAVSGYFTCAGDTFLNMKYNRPVGTMSPTQIRGLVNLGRVHALFTHLDEYLRKGDLLPGDGTHPYRSERDPFVTPAYEFTVQGEQVGPDAALGLKFPLSKARVIARKIRGEDRWLVATWANFGEDRDITVTIDPRAGPMTFRARRAGSIYLVDVVGGRPRVRLIDVDPMNPTRNLFPAGGSL